MPAPDLSAPQHKALNALLQAASISAAAELAGLHERTVRKYLEEPEFRSAYREARRGMLEQTTATLQSAASEAVTELRVIMADTNMPPASRVRAAHIIVDYAYRGLENEDFNARLEALEREEKSPAW